ncbi:MAG: hypothetical protein HKP52_12490 [Desulfofustis sp.]|nr:hypothetical protein [Desulfofustis sp.]
MKIILSRKGFDSASGGCPSPILPDGRLTVLPIPDPLSSIRYGDISMAGIKAGKLVEDLTDGRVGGTDTAHLDPDITPESLKRKRGWRPIFGQRGAAQGHLRNQRVGPGDLFLFYGLFKETDKEESKYRWKKSAVARHIIWGWLQVDEIFEVTPDLAVKYGWMSYHPHFEHADDRNNVIYLSKQILKAPGSEARPGSGVFSHINPALLLSSARWGSGASSWELPGWCYPKKGVYPLSYHGKMERWQRSGATTLLRAVPRGQEFVLDTVHYPEAIEWVSSLLTLNA